MDVLYEKCSMSNVTFLISLCKDFNSSAVGSASVTCRVSVLPKNKPQSFFKKRCTPSIPFVSQGLDCSNGPRNISYKRRVSAPYFSTIISGFTTLNMDLDIFSTAHPQIYLPSSNTNSASLYSGRQFLKASISNRSLDTIFTSTWIGVTSYWSFKFKETNLLVPLMRYTKFDRPWIIPWLINFLNGSSSQTIPKSNKNLFQKRL